MIEYVKKLSNVEQHLQYKFTDHKLLGLALTHSSQKGANNQWLEFLGDAVLNLIIAEYLYEENPSATEGDLTRLRSYLVKEETLASITKKLLIQDCINLGLGELKTGGYNKNSILADTLEAIIAAIYLDSNFLTVKELVLKWYKDYKDYNNIVSKDPKTILQELLQSRGLELPVYEIVTVTGKPHHQIFQVICLVNSIKEKIYGNGASRKKAEQDAAAKVLKLI